MTDKPPQPVEVKNLAHDPLPVEVVSVSPTVDEQSNARADTAALVASEAAILRTADQRFISGIWERTQQVIALSVVEMTLVAVLLIVIRNEGSEVELALTILFGMANLVIGFYFGRTNHTRVGGTTTAAEEDRGR